jgi:hypothetical protein
LSEKAKLQSIRSRRITKEKKMDPNQIKKVFEITAAVAAAAVSVIQVMNQLRSEARSRNDNT